MGTQAFVCANLQCHNFHGILFAHSSKICTSKFCVSSLYYSLTVKVSPSFLQSLFVSLCLFQSLSPSLPLCLSVCPSVPPSLSLSLFSRAFFFFFSDFTAKTAPAAFQPRFPGPTLQSVSRTTNPRRLSESEGAGSPKPPIDWWTRELSSGKAPEAGTWEGNRGSVRDWEGLVPEPRGPHPLRRWMRMGFLSWGQA